MTAELGDDEFVGYIFLGSPPRRHRLWFLERHLEMLFSLRRLPLDVGVWTEQILNIETGDVAQYRPLLRYEHDAADNWVSTWELTFTVIEHVTTFGRDDDIWRLGVWPD